MPLTLDDLRPNPGAKQTKKRVGRGHGSGKGKTAGRGTKGQKARSHAGVGRGFEGGQLPIQRRLPYKRGFTNINKVQWEIVNLGRLDALEFDGPVTPEELYARGITRGMEFPVKILAAGDLTRAIEVHAHAFSEAAKEQIAAAGGSLQTLARTDQWLEARPRSRRLQINRDLKQARVGKVGAPSRKQALAGARGA
ncbi:MAG: 50S ribosomal protein L15 [Chloroflexia bacterium]|nr:50S ribosomal protein L15 [Chloroflexia bacterium]